jgi:S1-C subfamily serine protease
MIRVFIGILAIVYLCFYSYCSAGPIASDPASQIYLIKSFQYNPVVDTYEEVSLWSAVYVAGSQVITNAHVVLDANNRPYGAYVLCTAKTIKNIPKCIYTAKLKKYDPIEDLALLEIHNINSQTPVILGQESMLWQSSDASIGEAIRAYGYPSNWWDTMTMTEGKLSGYLDGNYKIDANLDGGNSGGWAFNSKNEFIGIPYAVRSGYTTLGYVIPTRKVQKFINSPKEW